MVPAKRRWSTRNGRPKWHIDIVNELTVARKNTNIPIKDKNGRLLTVQKEQNKRWIEHIWDTLNQPNPTTTYDFDADIALEELPMNTGEITIEEVKIAKEQQDGRIGAHIGAILKHGGQIIAEKLSMLFNKCWRYGEAPGDWQRGAIVEILKKGNILPWMNKLARDHPPLSALEGILRGTTPSFMEYPWPLSEKGTSWVLHWKIRKNLSSTT